MCPGVWDLSTASSPAPLRAILHPHPVHRGNIGAQHSSWAWRGQRPQVWGSQALASVLFLARSGQISMGVRARLSWERTLWKSPDPFLSQILDPRAGRGGGKGKEGWLRDRQVSNGLALRAGWRGWGGENTQIQRLTDPQDYRVTPQTSPGTPKYRAWSPWRGAMPGPQLSAAAGPEPLGLMEKLL